MRKIGIFLSLMFALPLGAQAAEGDSYWGLNAGSLQYDSPGDTASLLTFTGRYGYDLLPFMSIEGRLMTSDREPESDESNVSKLQVDYLANISAKFNYNPSERVQLYLIAGASNYRFSFEDGGTDFEFSTTVVSYGVGFDLYANEHQAINFEYMFYADDTEDGFDYEMEHFGIGYVHRF